MGTTRRVTDVLLIIDEIESRRNSSAALVVGASVQSSTPRRGERIGCNDVEICTPDGRTLTHSLTFSVARTPASGKLVCSHLLVTGASGSGKTALCRVLLGLWPVARGRVYRPKHGLAIIPQTPLVPTTQISLLDLCTYPEQLREAAAIASAQKVLRPVLTRLQVWHLIQREGWEAVKPWEGLLSAGEQQCLAVARALFHCPRWLVLDGCINAMPEEVGEVVYHLLQEREIGVLSTSESGSFAEFHTQELSTSTVEDCVDAGGVWCLQQMKC